MFHSRRANLKSDRILILLFRTLKTDLWSWGPLSPSSWDDFRSRIPKPESENHQTTNPYHHPWSLTLKLYIHPTAKPKQISFELIHYLHFRIKHPLSPTPSFPRFEGLCRLMVKFLTQPAQNLLPQQQHTLPLIGLRVTLVSIPTLIPFLLSILLIAVTSHTPKPHPSFYRVATKVPA